MIVEVLNTKRIGITGATGFLGTALCERLLRCIPECEVVVGIRPGRKGVAERVKRDLVKNECFNVLRDQLGSNFSDTIASRLIPIAIDVTQDGLGLTEHDASILKSCNVIIHCAATVNFDSPLDQAAEINMLGASRLASVIETQVPAPEGREPTTGMQAQPHLISVSTAYVAANQKGYAHEELFYDDSRIKNLNWKQELLQARRARSDIEAQSRTPEILKKFAKKAHFELSNAGTRLLTQKTEQLRLEWVNERMVDIGRSRAQSLGWPDVYAYTKALGEYVLAQQHTNLPISIVRPSIIESALTDPFPGWIRGFRMGDPVIISYGKGLLKEFPGLIEGVTDVVPVDLVVAAILAVAASPPPELLKPPPIYHVASGTRNPLKYGQLVEMVREWFAEHPIYDSAGQPIPPPEWSFPGKGRVQTQLARKMQLLDGAERIVSKLPLRGEYSKVFARIESSKTTLKRALGYVKLYGAYTETEAVFRIDRLLELYDSLPQHDKEEFCFDPAIVDWHHYIHQIHLPSVVQNARVPTSPSVAAISSSVVTRDTEQARTERSRRAVLSKQRHIAVFDLENTLISSNVVATYAWLATYHLPPIKRIRLAGQLLLQTPQLFLIDKRDRSEFLRYFYRNYKGASKEQLETDSWELLNNLMISKTFPDAIRRVRQHKELGHKTLLVTGAVDFIVEPLKPLFDEIICAHMSTQLYPSKTAEPMSVSTWLTGKVRPGGSLSTGPHTPTFTGELETPPPIDQTRVALILEYAEAEGLSLKESVAYADSASDLPMLEAVGYPVVVNPEPRLASIAEKKGWPVEYWSKTKGSPTPLLPIWTGRYDQNKPPMLETVIQKILEWVE